MKFHGIALALVLSLCAATANAQEAAQQQLTPEQQAQLQQQDAQMAAAAGQVLQMIDANRIGEVWDLSTEVVKQLVPRASFVQAVGEDRARLGPPTARGEAMVSRSHFEPGSEVPAGLYINVAFPTRFSNFEEPVRELVSFRLDEDQVWRVSGYSLR